MKKFLKWAAYSFLGFTGLILIAAVIAYRSLDLKGLINDHVIPVAKQELGREVSLDNIETTFFPNVTLDLRGFKIHGDPDDKANPQPLLQVGKVFFEVNFWDAVKTMGRATTIPMVSFSEVKVNISRDKDGRFSFQDILDLQAKKAKEPPKPMDPQTRERIRNVLIEKTRILSSRLEFTDAFQTETPRKTVINDFNVVFDNLKLGNKVDLRVTAALLAETKNFEFALKGIQLPSDVDIAALPPEEAAAMYRIGGVDLKFNDFPVSAALTLAPPMEGEYDVDTGEYSLIPAGEALKQKGLDLEKALVSLDIELPSLNFAPLLQPGQKSTEAKLAEFWLANAGPLNFKQGFSLKNIVLLSPSGQGGKPFTFREDLDISITPAIPAPQIELRKLDIALDDVVIKLAAKLKADLQNVDATKGVQPEQILQKTVIESFSIASDSVNLSALEAMAPMMKGSLPPNIEMAGPLSFRVATAGRVMGKQTPSIELDLTRTALKVKGMLDKPAGTALKYSFTGEVDTSRPDAISIKEMKLVLGALAASVAGHVSGLSGRNPSADIKLQTNEFGFDDIVRVLPAAASSIPAGVKAGGNGKLTASVNKQQDSAKFDVDFHLTNMDLAVPQSGLTLRGSVDLTTRGTAYLTPTNYLRSLDYDLNTKLSGMTIRLPASGVSLEGSGSITAKGESTPGAVSSDAKIDFDNMNVEVKDTFSKPRGAPMNFVLAVKQKGDMFDIGRADIRVNELNLTGSGKANPNTGALDVKIKTNQKILLDQLGKTMPALANLPVKGGTLNIALAASGNYLRMEQLNAGIERFEFQVGRNSLNGSLRVRNPLKPALEFDIRSPYFNVDDLFPPDKSGKSDGGSKAAAQDNPALEAIKASGSLRIDRGVVSEFPFTGLVMDVDLRDGWATLRTFTFNAYGGSFSGSNTRAQISKGRMPYSADVRLSNVDINALLSEQTTLKDVLYGRADATVKVSGTGADFEDIKRNVTGNIGGAIRNGRWNQGNISREIVGPFYDKMRNLPLPFMKNIRLPQGDAAFKDLAGLFTLRDGRMNLDKPIVLNTNEGELNLTGSMGLDKSLQLRGTFNMNPAPINQAIGQYCSINRPLPIPVNITGFINAPRFGGIDFGPPLNAIRDDCVRQQADRAKKELEDRARAELEKAKERAREEAEKARKKAEDEAKKRGKDLINKGKGFFGR
ncbi:MAG: hypothetical protein GMKNLPBB_01264 [Myxococcota bacterium]|nr:hypothetical protein [Myxococcota bacterium]